MGITYHGPYADELGYEEHEGYAALVLADGRETGTFSAENAAAAIGYRGSCACGWRAPTVQPYTTVGEDAAERQWVDGHQEPLITAVIARHSVPAASVIAFARELRREAATETATNGTGQALVLAATRQVLIDVAHRLERLLDDERGDY